MGKSPEEVIPNRISNGFSRHLCVSVAKTTVTLPGALHHRTLGRIFPKIITRAQNPDETASNRASESPIRFCALFLMPEAPAPAPPSWMLCLWLCVLCLTLALLAGVVVGAIAFIRWRGIW